MNKSLYKRAIKFDKRQFKNSKDHCNKLQSLIIRVQALDDNYYRSNWHCNKYDRIDINILHYLCIWVYFIYCSFHFDFNFFHFCFSHFYRPDIRLSINWIIDRSDRGYRVYCVYTFIHPKLLRVLQLQEGSEEKDQVSISMNEFCSKRADVVIFLFSFALVVLVLSVFFNQLGYKRELKKYREKFGEIVDAC